MIISVEKIKELVNLEGWTDSKIEMKLRAVEQTIRAYTNNNFQNRCVRSECAIMVGNLYGSTTGFAVGDTVQVTETRYNDGLYVIRTIDDGGFDVGCSLVTEDHALVTKVQYTDDVVACAVNLMEWEVNNRGKVGVKSETLSRHSITYFDQDANNQVMGYPVALLGCLKPYRKCRC